MADDRIQYRGFRRVSNQKLSPLKNQYSTVEQIDVLRNSVYTILTTRRGERLMDPNFGSRLSSLVFDPNDGSLGALAHAYTEEALVHYENRVKLINIQVTSNDHELRIVVEYQLPLYLRSDTSFTERLELSLNEGGLAPILSEVLG